MKHFTKSTFLLFFIILLITSCKDNVLEDLETLVGKKCLEKTYEQYDKGQFLYKTVSEYNELNRLTKKINTSSLKTTINFYEYDKNNNLIKVTNEKGDVLLLYQYDSNNRLIKEGYDSNNIDFPNYVTSYIYYGNGNLQKQTMVLANLIVWVREYDENSRLIKKYDATIDGNPMQGIPLKIIKETETFYKYNSSGYVLSNYVTVDKKFFSSYDYEYDSDNRIVKYTEKDLNRNVTNNNTYEFDERKRVISKKTDNIFEIKYEYNSDDLIVKVTSFVNNQLNYTYTNEYNSTKRLIRTLYFNSKGFITSKEEKSYYSDGSIKTSQSYFTKNGDGTELFKAFDNEFTPCGDIIKNVDVTNDGAETRKIIATYIYK
jgi:hypothetical protein